MDGKTALTIKYVKKDECFAVMGDDGDFWLCKVLQNTKAVNKDPDFKAVWYEMVETNDKRKNGLVYKICDQPNYVPFESILSEVRLFSTDKIGYVQLLPKIKASLEKMLCSRKKVVQF